ncbi:ATP-binding protein [Gemmatimonadota bacterium]
MIPRKISKPLQDALDVSPIVLLQGPRQSGKTTLVRDCIAQATPRQYMTFDDLPTLAAARNDPQGFIRGLQGPVIIDEVQRIPDIALAIKAEVDRNKTPGRFLLSGSARALVLPQLSEALVGRMEMLTLWPFTQGELLGCEETFLDRCFSDDLPSSRRAELTRADYISRAVTGGFPEAVNRKKFQQRDNWFGGYLSTLLQQEVRDLAHIDRLTEIPRLLSIIGSRSAALLNTSTISREAGIPNSTLHRYLTLLEAVFLIRFIPAWSANLGKRLVRAPKVILTDSGLLAHLTGFSLEYIENGQGSSLEVGRILETFVITEVMRQLSWSQKGISLFHFRTHTGQEVDLVLEDRKGSLTGIEIKASETVRAEDFNGLQFLAEARPKKFRNGILLYTGSEVVPFGKNLFAVPMAALWEW